MRRGTGWLLTFVTSVPIRQMITRIPMMIADRHGHMGDMRVGAAQLWLICA
jgi:hypothetical protein